jgi:hypothetical protein
MLSSMTSIVKNLGDISYHKFVAALNREHFDPLVKVFVIYWQAKVFLSPYSSKDLQKILPNFSYQSLKKI